MKGFMLDRGPFFVSTSPTLDHLHLRLNALHLAAVYTTSTKRSSTIEMGTLATICEAVRIPVVAIGGINAVNAGRCIEAGCQGVAVVSALFSGNDTAQTASDLLRVVTAAKQNVHTEGQS